MNYSLRDYQGNELIVSDEQASKIAGVSELIEIEVAGQTHYLNPKNIASIKPTSEPNSVTTPLLDSPDYRGKPSQAKEQLRKKWSKRKG